MYCDVFYSLLDQRTSSHNPNGPVTIQEMARGEYTSVNAHLERRIRRSRGKALQIKHQVITNKKTLENNPDEESQVFLGITSYERKDHQVPEKGPKQKVRKKHVEETSITNIASISLTHYFKRSKLRGDNMYTPKNFAW